MLQAGDYYFYTDSIDWEVNHKPTQQKPQNFPALFSGYELSEEEYGWTALTDCDPDSFGVHTALNTLRHFERVYLDLFRKAQKALLPPDPNEE